MLKNKSDLLNRFASLPVGLAILLSLNAEAATGKKPKQNPSKSLLRCQEILLPGHQYPHGVDPAKQPNEFYTYGYEIEYSIQEMEGGLLERYAPTTDLIPRENWKKLTLDEKKAWIKANKERLFPDGTRKASKLEITIPDERMPERLIMDETGNIEIVSPKVFDDFTEYTKYLERLEQEFGPGYVQASLGVSTRSVFRSEVATERFVGVRFFLNELDTLSKLTEAYEKHLKNPTYIPAKSFYHPNLGPLSHVRADFFRRIIEENRKGVFENDVLNRIAGMDISYKYHSGVVYRPDIVRDQKVMVVEVRDCVKNFDCLQRRLLREKFLLSRDNKIFGKFYGVPHVDTVVDYNMLSDDVQKLLMEAFPSKGVKPEADEHLAAELFRNFAYPVQNWGEWLSLLELPSAEMSEAISLVEAAKHHYVVKLEELADLLKEKKITPDLAHDRVRIALAKFAYESKLAERLEGFLNAKVPQYKAMRSYF